MCWRTELKSVRSVEFCDPFWSSRYKEDAELLKKVQRRPQRWRGIGAPLLWWWEQGLFSLERRRLKGVLTRVWVPDRREAAKKAGLVSLVVSSDRTRGSGDRVEQEAPFDHQETLVRFHCVGDGALAQVAQGGCGVVFLEILKHPSRMWSWVPCSGWPCLSWDWTRGHEARGPCRPQSILWGKVC